MRGKVHGSTGSLGVRIEMRGKIHGSAGEPGCEARDEG